jgi:kynurenine formamidase
MSAPADAATLTRELVELVEGARIVDLTHTIEPGIPVYPTHPQYFAMSWETHDPSSMNQLLIGEHAGTHLDSPSHFYPDADDPRHRDVAAIPVDAVIGAAVKLDFLNVSPTTEVAAADLQRWEESNRPLRRGEAAVFHFGWSARWATFDAGAAYLEAWPGISRDAASYLANVGVSAVATDCVSTDGSETANLGAHFVLLEHGITIIENLRSLELLPREFLLVTLPLKLAGGTGSPVRAVALFVTDHDRPRGPRDA